MGYSTAGMLGLADKNGRRQQAGRDLNTLRQLHDFKRQGEMEEQQAEVAYQETLSKIKEQANGLLEGDRIAINKHAKQLQEGLRTKIQALGGSKKAFLRNGGISDLADYKDQVIGSEQMQVYKNNKINMEKILMIKEKKMGHLLNEKDMKALAQYNKTGQGELSYTGLLNEVEVDETLFEWGKQITPDDVLNAGSNRMAIIANYEADTGQTYNQTPGDKDLKAYIKYKGYGGLGKNVAIINARVKQAKADKLKDATPSINANIAVSQLVAGVGETEYGNMDFEKTFNLDRLGDNVLGVKPDNGISNGEKKGMSLSVSRYKLKGGASIAQGKEREFAKNYYDIEDLNEDGTMTLDPTSLSGTFGADGVGLSGKNKGAKWASNYAPTDLVLGYISMIQGEPHLITESVDKNGKPDGKNAERYGDGTVKGKPTMLIRMKHKGEGFFGKGFSDKDWYQEIPADSDLALKAMGDNFGPDNDLKQTQKGQQDLQTVLDQQIITARKQILAKDEQSKKLQKLDEDLKKISDKAIKHGASSPTINSEYFRLLTNQFNQNGLNRNLLVQSFYQAYAGGDESKLVDSADGKMFDQAIEKYGLKDVLLDKNVTDDQFIDKYYKADLKEHPGDVTTYSFATTFKQIYDKNINPDKQ